MLPELVVEKMAEMDESFNELVKKVTKAMEALGDAFYGIELPSEPEDSDPEYEIDERLRKVYEHPE